MTTRVFVIDWLARLPMAGSLQFVMGEGEQREVYLPWQMVFYLSAGTSAGILVSLVTKPVNKKQLDNYYALVRTPVQPGEEVLEPCTLPVGVEPPPARSLLPGTSLEIPVPSVRAVTGFAAGWVLVAAIIAGFVLIVR